MVAEILGNKMACRECAAPLGRADHFQSKYHKNYRVCKECWLLKHDNQNEMNKSQFRVVKADDNKNNNTQPMQDEQQLNPQIYLNSLQLEFAEPVAYKNTTKRVESANVLVSDCPLPGYKRFRSWIASHAAIEAVDIDFQLAAEQTNAIEALSAGLRESKTVRAASIDLRLYDDEMISDTASRALQELVTHRGSLQHLAIRLNAKTILEGKEWFDDMLFDALRETHLTTFAYYGINPVSDRNKKKALEAMRTNSSIKRIQVENFDNPDYRLALLASEKRNNWLGQLTSTTNTQLGTILEEALMQAPCGLHMSDYVPLLYHFLRERPDLLVRQADEIQASLINPAPAVEITNMSYVIANNKPKKDKNQRKGEKQKKKKSERARHYCWCCQEHFKGGKRLKEHFQSKQHRQGSGARRKGKETTVAKWPKTPTFHCWSCRESFQGEATWQKHLESKNHKETCITCQPCSS